MKKVTVMSIAFLLMASGSSLAQTAKYDKKVAKAAASKVAEKIGDMRGSIKLGEKPDMVTKEDLKEKTINTSFLPKPHSVEQNALPPISSLIPNVDYTVTGSVNGQKVKYTNKVVWEKFDRYGNPIK